MKKKLVLTALFFSFIATFGFSQSNSCLYVIETPNSTVSSILNELGLNVTTSTTIPPNLSSYDLVICSEYSACNTTTANYVGSYVQNGGGAILMGGTPSVFCGGGFSTNCISSWFGTSQYSNVGVSYAKVEMNNPLNTSLNQNDIIGECTGWGGAAVKSVSNATVLAKWDYGSGNIHSFVRSYQNGKVAFWASSVDYNIKTRELFKAVCEWCADIDEPEGDLVAFYPFTGNANDESGNGHHGTVYGASLSTDRNGNSNKAYSFDGDRDYIDLPQSNNIINRVQSISFWVYFDVEYPPDTDNKNQDYLISKAHDTGYQRDVITRDNTNHIRNTFGTSSSSSSDLITSVSFTNHRWYHIVFVRNQTTNTVYVAGNYDNSNTYDGYYIDDSDYLMIGTYHDNYGIVNSLNRSLKGKIDDIRIYNRALSAQEVYDLYTEGSQQHQVTIPNTPNGPSSGNVGQTLSYTTGGSSCNQGHSVEYRFDWGDGTSFSSWGVPSNNHTFNSAGTYNIKSQARCSVDNTIVSAWSNGLNITIENTGGGIPIKPVSSATIQSGQEFDVEIVVGSENEPITNLFGVSFDLQYTNTTYIDYVSYDKSGSFLGDNILDYVSPNDASGKISVGLTRMGTATGVSGTGSVIKIKLKSLSSTPGNTNISLSLQNVSANDPSGSNISLNPLSTTVNVQRGLTVWPGDCNNDGVVNQADILPIGLYWEKTGPVRTAPNKLQWIAQLVDPWSPELATYADANGDGVVNQGDILPIGINWQKTHGLLKNISVPISNVVNSNYLSPVAYFEENNNILVLIISTANNTDLFGVSFQVNYPADKLKVLSVTKEELFDKNALWYHKIDLQSGIISVALSQKSNQQTIQGNGDILTIRFESQTYVGSDDLEVVDIEALNGRGEHMSLLAKPVYWQETSQKNVIEASKDYQLFSNFPNPFNPNTSIPYKLKNDSHIQIYIYDINGRLVKQLFDGYQTSGLHRVEWDGEDHLGKKVSSGVYVCQFRANKVILNKNLILIK